MCTFLKLFLFVMKLLRNAEVLTELLLKIWLIFLTVFWFAFYKTLPRQYSQSIPSKMTKNFFPNINFPYPKARSYFWKEIKIISNDKLLATNCSFFEREDSGFQRKKEHIEITIVINYVALIFVVFFFVISLEKVILF